MIVAGVIATAVLVAVAFSMFRSSPATAPAPATSLSVPAAATTPAAPAGVSYEIDAGFYRVTGDTPEPLVADSKLALAIAGRTPAMPHHCRRLQPSDCAASVAW